MLSIDTQHVVLDVNGVGYLLSVPQRSMAICRVGDIKSFYVETIVREDSIQLYGFEDEAQKKCFNVLTSVQGVGNRTALIFLDKLSPKDITMAILSGDSDKLTEIPGVGKKLAGRIVQELKDKMMKQMTGLMPSAYQDDTSIGTPPIDSNDSLMGELMAALQKLGFQKSETYSYITKLLQDEKYKNKNIEELLPIILSSMQQK